MVGGVGHHFHGESHWYISSLLNYMTSNKIPIFFTVLVGGVEYVLSEVCVVDASRALPGAFTARLLSERGWSGHARDLRLHG